MEVKLINSFDIKDKSTFDQVFDKSLGFDGIFVEKLQLAFFTKTSIAETNGNMWVSFDEGYDTIFSEELDRIANFI